MRWTTLLPALALAACAAATNELAPTATQVCGPTPMGQRALGDASPPCHPLERDLLAPLSPRACVPGATAWPSAELDPPCAVLAGIPPGDRAARVAAAYRLDAPQAACAAEAAMERPGESSCGEACNGTASGWRRCLQRWPGTLAFWVGYLDARGEEDPALLEALAARAEGAEVAERLLAVPRAPAAALARIAAQARPERLKALLAHPALEGAEGLRFAAPLLERADARRTPDERQALALAAACAALGEGHLRYLAELWPRLPEPARAALRTGDRSCRRAPDRAPDVAFQERLAEALAGAGLKDEARKVTVAPPHRVLSCLLGERSAGLPWELALELGVRVQALAPEELALALPCLAPEEAFVRPHAERALAREERWPDGVRDAHQRGLEPLARLLARPATPGAGWLTLTQSSWEALKAAHGWDAAFPAELYLTRDGRHAFGRWAQGSRARVGWRLDREEAGGKWKWAQVSGFGD